MSNKSDIKPETIEVDYESWLHQKLMVRTAYIAMCTSLVASLMFCQFIMGLKTITKTVTVEKPVYRTKIVYQNVDKLPSPADVKLAQRILDCLENYSVDSFGYQWALEQKERLPKVAFIEAERLNNK